MIISLQLKQLFATLIQWHNPIYQVFWDTLSPERKTSNFSGYPIKNLFKINKHKKQLVFKSKFFMESFWNKHSIKSLFPRHKFVLYLVDIHQLTQPKHPEALHTVWKQALTISFPCTNLNWEDLSPFENLCLRTQDSLLWQLNVRILNMAVKEFRQESLPRTTFLLRQLQMVHLRSHFSYYSSHAVLL